MQYKAERWECDEFVVVGKDGPIGQSNSKKVIASMVEKLNLLESLLASHDWYYEFSDDHRVWRNGIAEKTRIEKLISELENDGFVVEANNLFNKYRQTY